MSTVLFALLMSAPPKAAAEVPDGEKAAWAAAEIRKVREGMKRMSQLVEDARSKKDIVKLNCVNEKVTQSKGLLRIAAQSEVTLREGLARADRDVVRHEFQKVEVATQKADHVRNDAELCVGEQARYSGETRVIVEVRGGGLVFDPTAMHLLDLMAPPVLLRPFQVSPYQ